MAKRDSNGNLITSPDLLLSLYLDTYKDRLRHRQMKDDLLETFNLKSTLWQSILKFINGRKSEPWVMSKLDQVLSKIKNNKTKDPSGLINELFKPGVKGDDLKNSLLTLMNGAKENQVIPLYLLMANIPTIFKKRGSQYSMNSERSIFILSSFRKILDRMLYNDKYPSTEENMSDSNIGAQKNKNIKNHLFVIYGMINSVINGNAECIDIMIYDIVQCFDALWVEDCMIDLYLS